MAALSSPITATPAEPLNPVMNARRSSQGAQYSDECESSEGTTDYSRVASVYRHMSIVPPNQETDARLRNGKDLMTYCSSQSWAHDFS